VLDARTGTYALRNYGSWAIWKKTWLRRLWGANSEQDGEGRGKDFHKVTGCGATKGFGGLSPQRAPARAEGVRTCLRGGNPRSLVHLSPEGPAGGSLRRKAELLTLPALHPPRLHSSPNSWETRTPDKRKITDSKD